MLGGVFNSGILATGAIADAKFNYRPAPPEIIERVRKIEAACGRTTWRSPWRRCSSRSAIRRSPRSSSAQSPRGGDPQVAALTRASDPASGRLKREGLLDGEAPAPA